MFTLSRTKLLKRSLLALVSSIAIIAGAFIAAKNIKLFQVNAANNSITVSFTDADWVYWKPGSGFGTPKLKITPGNYLAYCVDPATPAPSGSFGTTTFTGTNEDEVKLAIYIASADTTTTNNIMNNTWFSRSNIDTDYWDNTDPSEYANTSTSAGMANFKYIFMHIVVSYLYHETDGTVDARVDEYLSAKDKTLLNSIVNYLKTSVQNKSDIWLMAQNYKLYNIKKPVGENIQNIVWIENDPESGSIKVQKCDKETGSCTNPQGTASFSGIKFEVYNASGSRIYVPSKNQFYNNNALIASGTTSSNGSVTFSDLPTNILYRVVEADTNNSYLLTATPQTTTIEADGSTNNLNFSDNVIRGDVKFAKTNDVDGEPMANVIFKIKSTSGAKEEHLVVTDEDGVVDTSASHALHSFHTNGYDDIEEDEIKYLAYGTWFGGGTANDARGALPYDTYEITELKCDANKFCYDIGDIKKTFTISVDSQVVDLGKWTNDCADIKLETTATDADDDDKFIETGNQSVIKDRIEYCVMPGFEYTLKGILMDKATGKELLVEGRPITGESTISPAKECGSTTMLFKFDSTEFAGKDVVVFEKLYLGDEVVISHENIEDDSQTVSVISLSTTATDNSDGDKILAYNQDVEIKDVVDYCLKKDMEFTIKGVVMNKNTKEPLLVDGKKVEQIITLTPDSACGATEMIYSLNTKDLSGADLVVFEELYYGDELILSHSDFDNASQTVSVAPPPPDTGASTKSVDNGTLSNNAALIILAISGGSIGVYIGTRSFSRRKILGGKH